MVCILSSATKPGTHPSRVSLSSLLKKPRSYRATSQPPSFPGKMHHHTGSNLGNERACRGPSVFSSPVYTSKADWEAQ